MNNGWFPPDNCLTREEKARKKAFEEKKAREEEAKKSEAEI